MKYVALLRGIAPMNPNMRNDKLRMVFESLGLKHVQTVISSGNVLFQTDAHDVAALEAMIQKALPKQLGFSSTTIIRSLRQLQDLADREPFKGFEHNQQHYLTVTFLKHDAHLKPEELPFPYQADSKAYTLLGLYDNALYSVVNLTNSRAPTLMLELERKFGKEITTRTWKTVERIIKKLEDN